MLLDGNSSVSVALQARVIDSNDVWRGLKGLGNRSRVQSGFAGTEVERFQATVSKPAIERGGNSANGILQEGESFLDRLTVEGRCTHEDILHAISLNQLCPIDTDRVAIDVLGHGMNHDIRAVVQGVLNVWTQECIVDHHFDAMLMCHCCHHSDVHQTQRWVARALYPN